VLANQARFGAQNSKPEAISVPAGCACARPGSTRRRAVSSVGSLMQ
jgi:hypothetical protein